MKRREGLELLLWRKINICERKNCDIDHERCAKNLEQRKSIKLPRLTLARHKISIDKKRSDKNYRDHFDAKCKPEKYSRGKRPRFFFEIKCERREPEENIHAV